MISLSSILHSRYRTAPVNTGQWLVAVLQWNSCVEVQPPETGSEHEDETNHINSSFLSTTHNINHIQINLSRTMEPWDRHDC